jgi:tetratricopeptide (TPR) repeat protein
MQWIGRPDRRAGMQLPSSAGWEEKELLTIPVGLAGAFVVLDGLRTDPVAAPQEHVTQACLHIASWASGEGHKAINLAFLQAAALLRPAHAKLACEVGRLARDLRDPTRAESWLRRAVRLARSSQDWETYILAHLVIAGLYMRSGNYPAAKALATRGLRTSIRRRVKLYTGFAYHDLFVIAAETGKVKEAHELAANAFESYGADHRRIPALAHDVGCFWLNLGQFGRAISVFTALYTSFTGPADCALIAANAARAAAGLKDRTTYEQRRRDTVRALNQHIDPVRTGDVYLALAKAEVLTGNFEQARSLAHRAFQLATEHGLAQLRLQAEAELGAIQSEKRVAQARATESLRIKDRADLLVNGLVQSLESTLSLILTGSR